MQTTRGVRRATSGTVRLVLLGTLGLVLSSMLAAAGSAAPKPAPTSAPPAPTVTSGPSATVISTSATFSYVDAQAGVTFQCKLDAGSFNACPNNGKTYTNLANGAHTFSVAARVGTGPQSSPATRSWTVDNHAPIVTLSFPSTGGLYRASTWNAGCAPPGICGTASDATGVALVQVAVLQGGSPSFVSAVLASPGATQTAWRLGLPVPAGGSYTVRVRATDAPGNTTATNAQVSAGFVIDTAAPPPPTITQKPTDPTNDKNAHFKITDAEASATLSCRLDGRPFGTCGGTANFNSLDANQHCFDVRAIDRAGNVSATTTYCWTILLSGGFQITGSTDGLLHPGKTQPLNLVLGNPFAFTIRVMSVTIDVDSATTKSGCSGPTNLQMTQGLTTPVNVPAGSTRSLQQLGVASGNWPKLTMPNLSTNQDACKGAVFTLRYTGTATTP
jgi:hypothetical protein